MAFRTLFPSLPLPLPLPLALAFAAPLAAQAPLTLPASHQTVEGSTSTNVPFGRGTPVRVQCAYDGMLFPGPVRVSALRLRADGGTSLASKQVDCELRLSTMPAPLVAMSADFASNRGADETVVLPRQLLTLPAQSSSAVPEPFAPPIVLAVPFDYDPANGPLLLEIVVFGQPPGAYTLDATWVCTSPEVPFGPAACLPAMGPALRVESATTQVLWGRPWIVRSLDAPPGTLVVLALGSLEGGNWNGLVLPFDLAPLGAPGCFLSTDLGASWFQTTQGDGTASFPFVIPNVPSFVGLWLRFQAGALLPNANALGIVTSQAKKVQVCGYEPVGRVWSSGITATAGVREIGVAPVLGL